MCSEILVNFHTVLSSACAPRQAIVAPSRRVSFVNCRPATVDYPLTCIQTLWLEAKLIVDDHSGHEPVSYAPVSLPILTSPALTPLNPGAVLVLGAKLHWTNTPARSGQFRCGASGVSPSESQVLSSHTQDRKNFEAEIQNAPE